MAGDLPNRNVGDLGHIADHNELARLHDLFDATTPDDFEQVANKGVAGGYPALDTTSVVPPTQLATGIPQPDTFLRGDGVWASLATDVGPWVSLGSVTNAVALVGDAVTGGWTVIGNVGATNSFSA